MNDYSIRFTNEYGSEQQVQLYSVSERTAKALATGLIDAGYANVVLTGKELMYAEIDL